MTCQKQVCHKEDGTTLWTLSSLDFYRLLDSQKTGNVVLRSHRKSFDRSWAPPGLFTQTLRSTLYLPLAILLSLEAHSRFSFVFLFLVGV